MSAMQGRSLVAILFVAAFASAATSGQTSFHASLGNHDRPENVSYKPFNMNGARYYTYARKNVRFFVLDTTQMDAKQVAWIDAALQEAKEDWKIWRVILEPIFVKHGVNVVFSGHDHVYERAGATERKPEHASELALR